MANPNIRINITADDNASKKLRDLDDQVGKTEGGMGKMGKAAAIGGAALVALGVKSVLAFEDLGLTVGKFAEATGTTTEEASRLIEVAGDIGISSDTLSSSIGKMSKQLGANEDAFRSYGIEVAKNADGTTNVNETFLNAVDAINAIEDPLKKAEASAKVFGKGYQGMAELLGQSSDEIRTSLAAVSDVKVFDDKKVQDARDMRAAFDSIVDAGQDLMLTIGSALAPVITKLAPILVKVVEAAAPAAEALGEVLVSALEVLAPILEALIPIIKQVAKAISVLADVVGMFKPTGLTKGIEAAGLSLDALRERALAAGLSQEEFQEIIDRSAGSMVKTGDATKDLATLVEAVTSRVDDLNITVRDGEKSWETQTELFDKAAVAASETDRETRKLSGTMSEFPEKVRPSIHAVDTFAESLAALDQTYRALTGKLDEEEAWENVNAKIKEFNDESEKSPELIRDTTREIADYVAHTDTIPAVKKTEIFALLDQGKLAEAELALANLERTRTIYLDLIARGSGDILAKLGAVGAQASGGTIPRGENLTLVGEQGPELISAPGSKVYNAGQTAAMLNGGGGGGGGGGGVIVNATINVSAGADGYRAGQQIVAALKEYEARAGDDWRRVPR